MEQEPNQHAGVEARLRRLGTEPLPEHLAEPPTAMITPLTRTPTRSGWGRRPVVAAAAALALVLGGGVSWAAMGSNPGPDLGLASGDNPGDAPPEQGPPGVVEDLVPAQAGDDDDDDNDNDDSGAAALAGTAPAADENGERAFPHEGDDCKGPPLWITDPETAVGQDGDHRADQARAHAERRAGCPDDDDDEGTGPPAHAGRPDHAGPPEGAGGGGRTGERPFADDICKGPPPWAGTPPEGETEEARDANRAAEVAELEARRAAECPKDDNGDNGGPPEHAGRPDHAGPPAHAGNDDEGTGPPEHAGRPDHAGSGGRPGGDG